MKPLATIVNSKVYVSTINRSVFLETVGGELSYYESMTFEYNNGVLGHILDQLNANNEDEAIDNHNYLIDKYKEAQ